jgi:uncharacterized protein with HEPN domain
MPKRDPKLFLEDILSSLSKIEEYTEKLTFEEFSNDQMVLDAVVRNLEIIGEAARNIPQELKSENSDIAWEKMISMRNKVMHEYFGVDEEILWKTIKDDLPDLKEKIASLSKD